MPKRDSHLHGLLVVDKPGLQPSAPSDPGQRLLTSHDVVQMVRRWSGQRRIGHTGTLDPMASGVLMLCLGVATRLAEYYQGHDKEYVAEVGLGSATDTYDLLGKVTAAMPVPSLDVADIELVLARFRGEILQVPPAYSALKRNGESVHRKARRGEEVSLEPRPVTIHRLELLGYRPPDRLRLRVLCSAGTYVRSLAHDLGMALGTCGHLVALRRQRVGAFGVADARSLDDVERAAFAGHLSDLLLPLGAGLDMPKLPLMSALIRRFGYGQTVPLPISDLPPGVGQQMGSDMLVQGVDSRGRVVGILRVLGPARADVDSPSSSEPTVLCKAEKWFVSST